MSGADIGGSHHALVARAGVPRCSASGFACRRDRIFTWVFSSMVRCIGLGLAGLASEQKLCLRDRSLTSEDYPQIGINCRTMIPLLRIAQRHFMELHTVV